MQKQASNTYDWYPTFIFFGPPGSGKTRLASRFMQYAWKKDDELTPLKVEILDIGHALFSCVREPRQDEYFPIRTYTDLVEYLSGIENRNSDVIILDDLSMLNYNLMMESAQLRKGGKEKKDIQKDIMDLILSAKYNHINFIPPQLKDRGISSEKLRILLYNLIHMQKILIITCGGQLETEKIQDSILEKPVFTGLISREPNLPGKMPGEITHYVSEVFYMYVDAGAGGRIDYKIRFLPDGGMLKCPKDRSGRLRQLSKSGVLINDDEGNTFDKIVKTLPWPNGNVPKRIQT